MSTDPDRAELQARVAAVADGERLAIMASPRPRAISELRCWDVVATLAASGRSRILSL